MIVAWVLYLLLVGTLLALGASAVATALGLAGRPTRGVWMAALGGVVVLAIAAPRAGTLTIVSTVSARAQRVAPSAAVPVPGGFGPVLRARRDDVVGTVVRSIAFAAARVPAVVARSVLVAWLVTSAGLLALLLTVNVRLARARRHWPRQRIQDVDVRVAPSAGPAVIGMLRAEIVVPRSVLYRSADEQRLILAHEREHLRAGDHLLLALACAAAVALPWHPAVWYILARLRLAIELDCDARVLRRGASLPSYGALLIDIAAHGAGIRVGTLALADRPSHLERRLLAMTPPRSRYVLARGGVLCAVAGLLVLAACEAKIPTSTELGSMNVAAAEKAGAAAGLFDQARFADADFFLNGAQVTRDAARATDAARIGSVTVVKGAARDTVLVVTNDRLAALDSEPGMLMRARPSGADTTGQGAFVVVSAGETDPHTRPVIMIDGVVSTAASLAALRANAVASVEMIKPRPGTTNKDFPHGLLRVTTKTPQPPSSAAHYLDATPITERHR